MESSRRRPVVLALIAGTWLLVVLWQVQEHQRVVASAKSDLRNRAHEIASTLSAVTRAMRFRGAIFQERLEPVLAELAGGHANTYVGNGGLLAISLLNTEGNPVITAGETNLLTMTIPGEGEHWFANHALFVLPVTGDSVIAEQTDTNPTVVLPAIRDLTNSTGSGQGRDYFRREAPPGESNTPGRIFPARSASVTGTPSEQPERREGRRPQWMRWMNEAEFRSLAAKREVHGLLLVMSTENLAAISLADVWLRTIIIFFAGVSVLIAGFAWRNMARNSDLQIRLVRASEQNSHLREMNLAAAGLAHETRNPLNIIRGQAQLISRHPGVAEDIQNQSRIIMSEADKLTSQLTEFINYSRPRELRRTRVLPGVIAAEVVRMLVYDIDDKKLDVKVAAEPVAIEADEQLLRQVIFNLLLNAIQAVPIRGVIRISVIREGRNEALLEVADNGPGVPPDKRREIFKPYVTMHQKGTGLGLAIVQQIVDAHGWEIECLPNTPTGALFTVRRLLVAP